MAIETVQRSVRLDLYLPAEQAEQKQKILSSIRQYRATLRHCSGMLAMAADAKVDVRMVAFVQTVRVFLLIAALPGDHA